MHRTSIWFIVIAALLLSIVPLAAQDKDALPRFEQEECWFPLSEDERERIECGFVVVPEDRSQPDGPTIRIAVIVYRATGTNPTDDPLIYLDGGPGGYTLENASFGLAYGVVTPHIENRDVILFDQRGVGYSEPELSCPELDAAHFNLIDRPYTTENDQSTLLDAAAACRDRLTDEGINLAAYTTAENAADVNDIRIALGYDQVNLYGISYGTLIAQYFMRQYPQHARSVVLDSVVPVSVNLIEEHPSNTRRVFKLLFGACERDPACSEAYPELEEVFFKTVAQLNESPVVFEDLTSPVTGETYDVVVDGNLLIRWLYGQLYSTDIIPTLPARIFDLSYGDEYALQTIARSNLFGYPFFSYGMFFSVMCGDITQNNSPDRFAEAIDLFDQPEMRYYYENVSPLAIPGTLVGCDSWVAAEEAPDANDAIVSDIPTLIMGGEYDPVTPPRWGEQMTDDLSHSYFYLFPGYGHGVTGDGFCSLGIMQEFLQTPTEEPDARCMEWLDGPQFVLPN